MALCDAAAAEEREAALALDRWRSLQEASNQHCGEAERRFRRRAFERARDRALITLAMRGFAAIRSSGESISRRRQARRRRRAAHVGG